MGLFSVCLGSSCCDSRVGDDCCGSCSCDSRVVIAIVVGVVVIVG